MKSMNAWWCLPRSRSITATRPRALSSTPTGAEGPPMSVRTHPGCSVNNVMPRSFTAGHSPRVSEFSAALLARYSS
jgi:hypothetical protein